MQTGKKRLVMLLSLIVILLANINIYSFESITTAKDSTKDCSDMNCCDKEKTMDKRMPMKGTTSSIQNSDMVIKGTVDLIKLDKNKDGKVFQDQMHWNVISDKAGVCPVCKIQLKEVTLKQARQNLIKNGFKVK